MKYISEKDLRLVFNRIHKLNDSTALMKLLDDAIRGCKELPPPQWQTIEDFKANPVNGWCWVDTVNLSTKMCFFSGAVFYTTDELTGFYVPTNITHVMPIKTPEAPK